VPAPPDPDAALAPPDLAPVPPASRLEQLGLVLNLLLDLAGGCVQLLLFPLRRARVRARFRRALTEELR